MNCINRNTKEFKKLLGETLLSPMTLSLKIAKWQLDNNTDTYPSASDITGYTKSTTDLFINNPEFNIGSPVEFNKYAKSTDNPTIEGFVDYLSKSSPITLKSPLKIAQDLFSNDVYENTNFNKLIDEDGETPSRFSLRSTEYRDLNFNRLFFRGKQSDITGKDLLESLKENYSKNFSGATNDLVSALNGIKGISDVKFTYEGEFQDNSAAYYDSSTQTIHVNKPLMYEMATDDVISTLLHELVHYKTVDALNNPQTQQDQELIDTVNGALEKIGPREEYGFTNKEEFVAELYSNPQFYDTVKDLFSRAPKNHNWFTKIMDAIRRLLGVKKTSEFDKLFETIVKSVKGDISREAFSDNGIFNKLIERTDHFDNTTKHLLHINNLMKDNIDKQIKYFKKSVDQYNQGEIEFEVNKLTDLFERIESNDNIETLVPMFYYLTQMQQDINKVVARIDDNALAHDTDKARLNNISSLEGLLENFELVNDVKYYLESLQKELNTFNKNAEEGSEEAFKIAQSDIDAIRNVTNYIDNLYDRAKTALFKEKQEVAVSLLTNPLFLTKAEKQLRDQYAKEYGDGSSYETTKEQYINDQFQNRPDELQERLEFLAKQYVYNPSDDISNAELKLSDPLNINSNLVSVAVNMLLHNREQMINGFRESSLSFRGLYNEYSKEHSENNVNKKYKNIITQDEKGKHYLINPLKMEVLDSYREMRRQANLEMYGDNVAFPISSIEHQNVKDIGSDSLFRNEKIDRVNRNTLINLQVSDKTSKLNAKVRSISEYSKTDIDKREDVVKKYTKYNNYDELLESKDFEKADSFGSKRFPELYQYFKGEKDLVIYDYRREYDNSKKMYTTDAYQQWFNQHFEKDIVETGEDAFEETISIREEFKNPAFENLTRAELNAVNAFMNIAADGKKTFGEFNSLLETVVDGYSFVALPTMNKSDFERRVTGDFKGMYDNFKDNLRNIQHDDYFDGGEPLNADGTAKYGLRVHQRGHISPENQSLELFDLFFAEYENVLKYALRREFEKKMKIVADISKGKQYFSRSAKTGDYLRNSLTGRNPIHTIDGSHSKEYAKIVGLMETALYDIYTYHGGKLGQFEVNKITSMVNGFAASVALTANAPTGIANIVNGRAQLQLDAIGKYHYNTKDLLASEKDYFSELSNSLADLKNPIKTSKVNLTLELFDFVGGVQLKKQSFMKDSFGKKILSKETMNSFNDMGEHYMSYVLTTSILRGIKVMNKDRKFIDKDGNVVDSKDKAASMYDMLIYDKDSGTLKVSDNAVYTTHTLTSKLNEGGMSHITALIKKRSHDMYGAYDSNLQSEIQKQWWGKSLTMFKRFLIPGIQYRYRNWKSISKHPDLMADNDKIYNTSLKEYEEGYYISLGRMVFQTMKNLKTEGWKYAPEYYNKLSDYEKSNIRKATTELITRGILLPALALAISLGWDDDKPYWLLYQVARLSSELGQFSNPLDMTKIIQNPVAGINFIQNALKLGSEVVFFIEANPGEKDSYFGWLNEDVHGNNKVIKAASKMIPVASQLSKEYKNLYNALQ